MNYFSYQANRYVEEAVASQIEDADIVQVPLFNGRHELLDPVFLGNQEINIVMRMMLT